MDFFKYDISINEFLSADLFIRLVLCGLCFAVVFIFEAVALYTIAVRGGYKNKWMAFVPFFNTYYIGVCAQKNKFYNVNAKTLGLAVAILEVVLVCLNIVNMVAENLLKDGGYLVKSIEVTNGGNSYYKYVLGDDIPTSLQWAALTYNYLGGYILGICDLIFVILEGMLLVCFFQTYACRRYLVFAITSVLFPVMGILFFIVRNNVAANYRDFLRAEQARQYQQYRRQGYDDNPYNGNYSSNQNPYNRNTYNSSGNVSSDPFGDFGGSRGSGSSRGGSSASDDPFGDFDK